jgi:hypothetical protein
MPIKIGGTTDVHYQAHISCGQVLQNTGPIIHHANKPDPSLSTIVGAFAALSAYGTFQLSNEDGYNIGTHDRTRLKAFFINSSRPLRTTDLSNGSGEIASGSASSLSRA